MELNNICMGCMEEKTDQSAKCPSCGFVEGTVPDSPLFLPPRTILEGKYLIGKVLGQGGFGITYLAWDINLNIKLAIKEYFPQELATRAAGHSEVSAYSGSMGSQYEYGLDKFLKEARTLAQFEAHPNIVSVRDYFEANGTAYFVMNYIEGVTVKDYLRSVGGKLPVEQAQAIMMPVLDALKEVHAVNILHRDISPDNIFITPKGQIIIVDFGAARQSIGEKGRSLSIILKPGYAPEEQYRSKGVQGPWTDIYAVAATYYHLITGWQPPEALERLIEDALVPPSQLGVELNDNEEKALFKALSVKAQDRFQTVEEFQAALMGEKLVDEELIKKPEPEQKSELETKAETKVETGSEKKVLEKPASRSSTEKRKSLPVGLILGLAGVVMLGVAIYIVMSSGVFNGRTAVVTNIMGNTPGNIANGGLAAIQGERVYFRSNVGSSLFVGNFQNGDTGILSTDSVWFINVYGDWIYYSNRDDNNRLYKLKTDGTNRTVLSDSGAWFVTYFDNWIYYIDEADDYKIYKVDPEGNNRIRITEDSAWFINVFDNWVYYVNPNDGNAIYRVRVDGRGREKVNDNPSCCINVYKDEWIYYINEADNSRIYRIRIDGTGNMALNDNPSSFINIADDWIFYVNNNDNFSLYKMRFDGSGNMKIASEPVRYVVVAGEWVFYVDRAEDETIYKVRTDGTGRRLAEDNF